MAGVRRVGLRLRVINFAPGAKRLALSRMIVRKKHFLSALSILSLVVPAAAFAQLPDPLKYKTFPELIGAAASLIFTLLIPISLIAIVWSGIAFITAGGSEDRVKKARAWLLWAIIGLGVGLIGIGFVKLVLEAMGS